MRKIVLALMLAALFQAADAKPSKPAEPPAAAVKHAAKICTETGGFGRVFGRGYGHVDATADDDWSPFEKLTIETRSVTAEAAFRGAGDNDQDEAVAAERFFKALDEAVAAKHKFPHREAPGGGSVVFHTAKERGTGLVLELRLGADSVIATCADLGG